MRSRFKQLALARLREQRRKTEANMAAILRVYTEQQGWALDMAAGRDNTRFAAHLLEQAQRDRPRPVKEIKVYRGPGYPIDPERESRRELILFSPVWNLP